eukprot:CAMPEP_0171084356 /NCGR_PEP_ID=MMETSP0766_2-20121228/18266_1 /TAXON_ID=439317 /ORGANISM="Gambierdiscus australes, Strain CAWD 149" /LENGTH=153 /DNA_ID=CAMNT_0011541855 /DNA_START=571 /DNA_END=1033 /DNA_ORIENTATION=+
MTATLEKERVLVQLHHCHSKQRRCSRQHDRIQRQSPCHWKSQMRIHDLGNDDGIRAPLLLLDAAGIGPRSVCLLDSTICLKDVCAAWISANGNNPRVTTWPFCWKSVTVLRGNDAAEAVGLQHVKVMQQHTRANCFMSTAWSQTCLEAQVHTT